MVIYSEFSHSKLWFSIAIFVSQRVQYSMLFSRGKMMINIHQPSNFVEQCTSFPEYVFFPKIPCPFTYFNWLVFLGKITGKSHRNLHGKIGLVSGEDFPFNWTHWLFSRTPISMSKAIQAIKRRKAPEAGEANGVLMGLPSTPGPGAMSVATCWRPAESEHGKYGDGHKTVRLDL